MSGSDDVVRSADNTGARLLAAETGGQIARLRAEVKGLREALDTRAVIEQAKGILIATTGCDAEAAFEVLRQQSRHENRKVHDVAIELVALHRRPGMRVSPSGSPREFDARVGGRVDVERPCDADVQQPRP